MAKSIDSIASLAADVQAVQALQAQIRQPLKELLEELVNTARDFAGVVGSERSNWLNRSRFDQLTRTASIGYGDYTFGVTTKGDFLLSAEDAYGSSGQTVITVAEAADFAATLEREFIASK